MELDNDAIQKLIDNAGSGYPALKQPSDRGWECPKCGSVYAPFVQRCRDCRPDRIVYGKCEDPRWETTC